MPKGLSGAGEKFSSRVPGGSREEVEVFFDDDRGGVVVVLAPVMVIKNMEKTLHQIIISTVADSMWMTTLTDYEYSSSSYGGQLRLREYHHPP